MFKYEESDNPNRAVVPNMLFSDAFCKLSRMKGFQDIMHIYPFVCTKTPFLQKNLLGPSVTLLFSNKIMETFFWEVQISFTR